VWKSHVVGPVASSFTPVPNPPVRSSALALTASGNASAAGRRPGAALTGDYRDNDVQASRQWRRRHPEYWRAYRRQHPNR
jgi:hypothetical protein